MSKVGVEPDSSAEAALFSMSDEDKLPEPTVLSYTRSNGTVETVSSIEEFVNACPAAKGLSIEQAAIVARSAIRGQRILAEQEQSKPPATKTEDKAPVINRAAKTLPEDKPTVHKTLPQHIAQPALTTPGAIPQIIETLNKPDKPPNHNEQPRRHFTERLAATEPKQDEVALIQPIAIPKILQKAISSKLTKSAEQSEKPPIKRRVAKTKSPLPKTKTVNKLSIPLEQRQVPEALPVIVVSGSDELKNPLEQTEQELPQATHSLPELAVSNPTIESTEPSPTIETEDQTTAEISYPAETTLLLEQLQAPTSQTEQPEPPTIVIESPTPLENSVDEFAQYFEDQPKPEIPNDNEALIPDINQLPLEEIFVKLTVRVQENQDQDNDVQTAVQELSEIFIADNPPQQEMLYIRPAVTQQLVRLLQTLGHENPQKALFELVEQRDMAFLAYAIKYLSFVAKPDDQQEWLVSSIAPIIDYQSRVRFGKLLLKLVTGLALEPAK